MFRLALVIFTLTMGVNGGSPSIDGIRACMATRAFICLPFYETLVKEMREMTDALLKYETFCAGTKLYDQCWASDLLCEGLEWDYDCFVTRTVKFLEDVNLCKDIKGQGSCLLEGTYLGSAFGRCMQSDWRQVLNMTSQCHRKCQMLALPFEMMNIRISNIQRSFTEN